MICPSCGTRVADLSRICVNCGVSLAGVAPEEPDEPSPESARVEHPAPPPRPVRFRDDAALAPPQLLTVYAGFWRRVGAWFVDYFVLVIASALFGLVLSSIGVLNTSEDEGTLNLIVFAGIIVYMAAMESSAYQGTVGKLIMGLKVTDLAGQRISFVRALGRYFAELLSGLILCIGYVMAAFTPRRQALHDLIAGTLVVHKTFDPQAIASAGAAPKVPAFSVTLMVISAAVTPIVAVMALMSLPAAQDYAIRMQVTEGLTLAAAHKAAVATEWQKGGRTLHEIDSTVVGRDLKESGPFVHSIHIASGAVVIKYGEAANPKLSGGVLALVPAVGQNRQLAWVCGYAAPPAGFEVSIRDYRTVTTVPAEYLPSGCRNDNPTKASADEP